jgi:hypothetical protein
MFRLLLENQALSRMAAPWPSETTLPSIGVVTNDTVPPVNCRFPAMCLGWRIL